MADIVTDNVTRCQQLVLDFRKENYARVWKEDVLQLYNVMWYADPLSVHGQADGYARYAWLNSRGTRPRRQAEVATEQAAAAARASHLASLQNGYHTATSSDPFPALLNPSPSRISSLSAVVSSVRDERDQPVTSANHDSTDPSNAESMDVVNGGDHPIEPFVGGQSGLAAPPTKGNETIALDGTISSATTTNGHVPPNDTKRELALRLLDAALSRVESDPLPAPVERKPIPTPSPHPVLPAKSLSIKDMIKLKMLPIDFAVNAARLAMGEGAEEDEMDFASAPAVITLAELATGMDLDSGLDGVAEGISTMDEALDVEEMEEVMAVDPT